MTPALERLALKLVIGLGCAMLLALLIHDRNRWKEKASHYSEMLAGERAAHATTVANYRAAAEQARRADAANAARVNAAQAAINERTSDDFQSRIAAARAADQRLRRNSGAAADPGAGRATAVPSLPAATQSAAQGPGEDGLHQSDRLIATEQAIQLDALIDWVEAQAAVEVGGD